MAETLTFENTTEKTSVDNLSAEEQDSLEVGRAMVEAQDDLLAGKYKDAKELEKAYVELSKKLGEKSDGDSEETESESEPVDEKSEETEDEPEEENPTAALLDNLYQQAVEGKDFSKETLQELQNSKPEDIANLYLQYRNEQENNPANTTGDFSENDVKELKGVVGGEENYNNMLTWAQQNLSEQEIGMFDQVMGRGDPLSAFFAIRSLAYRYNDAIGYDGKMVTGKAPSTKGDTFRSQAEVVKAMSDPRYDRDPAYRLDIQEKLERSNIKF